MKKVTLKDIANELNVTVGTVSHVLNGINDISEKTKTRVLETADRLGYISNGSAVSLRSGKTNTVAIIVPDISNPHFANQIKLIQDKFRLLNYSVIILNTNEDADIEYQAITTACSKQADGILLCPCQRSMAGIELMDKLKVPYVLMGRYFSDLNTDFICADDVKGGYLAGKYLVERGYTNPIYIGAYNYVNASTNRFEGMRKAFADAGIKVGDERFIQISAQLNTADTAIEKIDGTMEFDSIVAYSDIIAFDIISYTKKMSGKSVPVIGFDAINSHLFMPFDMVSVGMKNNGWADKAAEILVKKINGSSKTYRELIDVELVEFKADK